MDSVILALVAVIALSTTLVVLAIERVGVRPVLYGPLYLYGPCDVTDRD